MPTSYSLGKHFETFVQAQLATGRYNNASEVMRQALRLMEERERRVGMLDSALDRGMSDERAGQVMDAGHVFDRLEAKYASLVDSRRES